MAKTSDVTSGDVRRKDVERSDVTDLDGTLFVAGMVHTAADPSATALHIDNGHVTWVGADAIGRSLHPGARVVDLGGSLVTPGFVDAHAHVVATGIAAAALDLTGCRSAADLLDRVAAHPGDGPVIGSGWDNADWDDPALPGLEELDRAARGRAVHLARVDLHSALLSSDQHPDPGAGTVFATLDVHPRVAESYACLTAAHRGRYIDAALAEFAAHGITEVHDMASPLSGGLDGALAVLEATGPARPDAPQVRAFLGTDLPAAGLDAALAALAPYRAQDRFLGFGGDTCLDGSLGSRTAALAEPYADDPASTGELLADAESARDHLIACLDAGVGSGFHVIGDRALAVALDAHEAARAARPGTYLSVVHRLEHVEMLRPGDVERIRDLALVASMQPDFMRTWGGDGGMYEQRLGRDRARALNPFAALSAAGVTLAFGSDAPVLPPDPWRWVQGAIGHPEPEQRISARAAFLAASRAGRRVAGVHHPGSLLPGVPADLVVWEPWDLVVHGQDQRIATWSTDARARTPLLPELTGPDVPAARLTVRDGTILYHCGDLLDV